MTNIAFVYTEYQQNILFAVCEQENIEIDILFVRKDIPLHKNADRYMHKVIYYEDNSFSWRSIGKYYQEYMKTMAPHIDNSSEYRIFTWSMVNPMSRYAINLTQCKNIDFIEDGSGSYAKWGFNNYNSGFKTFAVSSFIFLFTNIFSKSMMPLNHSYVSGWSLFDGCYPDFNINKNLIEHHYFQKAMMGSMQEKDDVSLEKGSMVFIQQPYVEMTILNEDEYIRIHTEAVVKMKKHSLNNRLTIIWKLHPRTDIDDEVRRVKKIKAQTDVEFEIIKEKWNMEYLAYINRENKIQYFSLGSSSLYVISALVSESTSVFLIENEALKQKLPAQVQINEFYKSIGIGLI